MSAQISESGIERIQRLDDSLLAVRDLETGYGDLKIVDGIDLDVRPNEIVVIFGPNGAGKSTFMKALIGILPVWHGSVLLDGQDLSEIQTDDMVEHGVGYVPQESNVFGKLTISENLDIGGLFADNPVDRRADVLEIFPALNDLAQTKARNISGGQRQMLAMARALMADPELLLIDEPSAGLAPDLVQEMFDHVDRIREAGTAILLIEQNVKAGLAVSDRGYVFHGGENRFEGDCEDLRDNEQINDLYLGK
jgi:branched-chain amino acid transport system ATP-binding protein